MDRIWVSGWGCVALALTLLVLPLPWVAAAVLAAAVHELCHYLAIAALGGQVGRIAVGSGGAAMELGCLSPVRELLAAAAGPVGSLSLMLMGRFFPRLALCGLVQGLFNLLPIYPLDGGRILRSSGEYLLDGLCICAMRHVFLSSAGIFARCCGVPGGLDSGKQSVHRRKNPKQERKSAKFRKITCKHGLHRVQYMGNLRKEVTR